MIRDFETAEVPNDVTYLRPSIYPSGAVSTWHSIIAELEKILLCVKIWAARMDLRRRQGQVDKYGSAHWCLLVGQDQLDRTKVPRVQSSRATPPGNSQ